MLNAIRTAASNWLGRAVLTVIMSVLILSFAIWGIGDIFRGGVNRTLATVGSAKITSEEFRTGFNNELRQLQARVRRPVTTEEARAFGLDRALLNRKIDEAALAQKAKSLGLALDGASVIGSIMEAQEFQTAGQFDRAKLASALSQAGLSDKEFIEQQTEHLLRLQLYNGLLGGMSAPTTVLKAVHAYRDTTRDVEAIFLDPAKVPAPPPPDEAAMKAYYEAQRADFRTVETRKATIIALNPADFAGDLKFSEDDLRAEYSAGLLAGRYGTPERRTLSRVLFDTEAEAKDALAKLTAGGDFAALLAAKKLNASDADFGAKTKADLGDAALRNAVFGAREGQVVGPFKDVFGFVLYRVGTIEPAKTVPFEAVRGAVEAQARADKLARDTTIRGQYDDASKTIEDQRIAGKSLAEAAQAAGVKAVVVPALDKEGKDGKGSAVSVPGGSETVAAVFASDIGLDNEPLNLKDGSHIWYEVNGVDSARDRPFEDVKGEVITKLEAQARDKALLAQATEYIKKINEGASLASIAQAAGVSVERIAGIKRGAREGKLAGSGVDRTFSGPIGKAVTAIAADGKMRAVIVPTKANLAPYNAAEMERLGLSRQVAQGMADDMMGEYTAALRKELGVSINQVLLNQALGQPATN